MKTIFVIEQGSYSDYRVVGVFTSKAKAEKVADAINVSESYDQATVAEWPLDPAVDELNQGMSQWYVLMLRDGEVESCKQQSFSAYNIGGESTIWKRSTAPAYRGKDVKDVLTATVWATDEKHAIKVANEIRIQMIAGNKWK